MGRGRKLRWNFLVVCAVLAFAVFIGGVAFMVWGVRWMGGQKQFRLELAQSIRRSVLEGVTARGPDGAESEPHLDELNELLLFITDSEYFVSRGEAEAGAEVISLEFGDGAALTFTRIGDLAVRAEFDRPQGRDYRYDLGSTGLTPEGMMDRIAGMLGLGEK